MKAWELLKHLEEGGEIEWDGNKLSFKDLAGWDYDCIRNPEGYMIITKETTDV